VGKFYATYLIQDYFRRFKARKPAKPTGARKMSAHPSQEDKAYALQVLFSCFNILYPRVACGDISIYESAARVFYI
jgi:hypothetical protein